MSKRFKVLPILGSFHGSDLLNVYGGEEMTDYLVNFVNNLDPNGATGIEWPQYSVESPQMLTFLDGLTPLKITTDDYRVAAIEEMTTLSLKYPI